MDVGEKVRINPNNVPDYFDFESNPIHLTGVIMEIHDKDEFGSFAIDVEFSDGTLNAYDEKHLIALSE